MCDVREKLAELFCDHEADLAGDDVLVGEGHRQYADRAVAVFEGQVAKPSTCDGCAAFAGITRTMFLCQYAARFVRGDGTETACEHVISPVGPDVDPAAGTLEALSRQWFNFRPCPTCAGKPGHALSLCDACQYNRSVIMGLKAKVHGGPIEWSHEPKQEDAKVRQVHHGFVVTDSIGEHVCTEWDEAVELLALTCGWEGAMRARLRVVEVADG